MSSFNVCCGKGGRPLELTGASSRTVRQLLLFAATLVSRRSQANTKTQDKNRALPGPHAHTHTYTVKKRCALSEKSAQKRCQVFVVLPGMREMVPAVAAQQIPDNTERTGTVLVI